MRLKYIEPLSKEEVKIIDSAAIELLSSVGIKVDAESARKLFEDYGCEVNNTTNFVKISEELIREKLKTIPNSFKLYGPDGSFNFDIDTKSTKFATIGTPVKIYDPSNKRGIRRTILDDTIQQIKIVDSLENIVCSHIDVWPNDIKVTALHAHCIYQWYKNSKKPYGLGCLGKLASQDMMNMTSLIVGGDEELKTNPRLVGFMNPTSPLHLPQLMTNGYEIFAKYNQPTIIAPEAMAGSTAPVTLAGVLAQIVAETLGGAVLGQLYNPGSPIFFATVSNTTDMRSGNSAIGAIETGLITAGMAQMARFYDIPSRGPGGVTDSKVLDIQNGFERLQTLMLAVQAGINYITCAGTYEATLVEALELLVIDDELASICLRAMDGIEVNDDTLGLEVIKKVATSPKKGVTYLSEQHTRIYMKKELYIPKLIDRNRRSSWRKKGSKDIIERARDRVNEILQNQIPPETNHDTEIKLLSMIKDIEARSIDLYKEIEGITADSVTIEHVEVKSDKEK
ncbi:MAG: trimethylamine methyltransferase family protein [Candidatus Thorarchaeota archaeon]